MKHKPRSKRPYSIKRSGEWYQRVARAAEYLVSPGEPSAYPDQDAMTAALNERQRTAKDRKGTV